MGRKYNSFNEYLEVNYSKSLTKVLLEYFKENALYTSKEVYENQAKHKLDMKIKISIPYVYHFTAPDYNLDFDIVIDALTEITKLKDGELQTDLYKDLFTIKMSGVLHDGLSNVKIHSINLGSCHREFDKRYSLSSFLVPYINIEQYDDYAKEFLEEFYPKSIKRAYPVRTLEVVKKMGLNVKFGDLPKNCFGKCIFDKEKITIYNYDKREKETVVVDPGTILINREILDFENIGALNNTVIHECLHWFLHKKYFELQKLLNSGETSLSCFLDEMKNPDKSKMKNKYYMELQARAIAPRILMPEEPARRKFKTILEQMKGKNFSSQIKYIRACVAEFADHFGISLESSKIRLVHLGFSQVLSVLNKVNGNEIVPFSTGEYKLKPGQTFIIDAVDAIKIIKNNPEFRRLVMDGKIIYVDGFFVVNDPKYVLVFKHQKPRLTALALKDVSSCCLLFDLINESVTIDYDPEMFNYYTFCNGGSSNKYNRTLNVNSKNDVNAKVIKKLNGKILKSRLDLVNSWIEKMKPMKTFGERLTFLCSEECIGEVLSDRTIGRICGLDGKTIASYKAGKSKPDLINFIKLSGGLRMHPRVSRFLSSMLGYDVHAMEDEPYTIYSLLMQSMYNQGLKRWNELITEAYPDKSGYLL